MIIMSPIIYVAFLKVNEGNALVNFNSFIVIKRAIFPQDMLTMM